MFGNHSSASTGGKLRFPWLIKNCCASRLIAILIGRLRLDLETCKKVYVKMTKKIFETDKTIAGLPYRKTLFKASRLEEVIKEVVREATMREEEETVNMYIDPKSQSTQIRRTSTSGSWNSSPRGSRNSWDREENSWGNENALLYDCRPKRCKT